MELAHKDSSSRGSRGRAGAGLFNLLCLLLTTLFCTQETAAVFPSEAFPTKSGYLPVSSTSKSSIYYAFYEAQQPTSPLDEIPIVIWLQGGPGCSSMIGNFYELGPWIVSSSSSSSSSSSNSKNSIQLKPNPGAWNRRFGLLFLDNPIGVGFSVASSPDEIPTDESGVAAHLFYAIESFLLNQSSSSSSSFRSRPVYITGESYAGKYVPAIAQYILERRRSTSTSTSNVSTVINLAGVAIGNGLTDPVEQVKTHAPNAYYTGLINEKQRSELEDAQSKVVGLVKQSRWSEATDGRNEVLSKLRNMTGLATLYNMRLSKPYETELVGRLLGTAEAKRAMGVDLTTSTLVWEECSDLVGYRLHGDVMKSVRDKVEYLLEKEKYKVLLYQGQCDLRDGVLSTEAWMNKLKWEGMKHFNAAKRKVWRLNNNNDNNNNNNNNGEVAGYVQKYKGLSHVVVLDAGHLVPSDQPLRAQAMIEDWVLNRGLFQFQFQEEEDVNQELNCRSSYKSYNHLSRRSPSS